MRLPIVTLTALAFVLSCAGNDDAGTEGTATSTTQATATDGETSTSTDATATASTSDATSTATTDATSTSGGTTTSTSTDATSTSTTADATSTTNDPTTGDPTTTTGGVVGLEEVGSLVILGDSISDGGGQPPFYYNLLRADLEAKYGAIEYHNNAQSGSKTGALLGQAKGLPGALPGPVVAVITSGGNDMKAALLQVVSGTDGPVKAEVKANVDAALGELLAPDRFGAGVEVHVFEGNIYDASDGMGNFDAGNCAFGKGLPPLPTDMYFDAWNAVIAEAVVGRAQTPVDMHGQFYGHGYNNPPNWYAGDCTHPSTLGHDQLRRLFYLNITGEALP